MTAVDAAIQVRVSGPGGTLGQTLPDEGGTFEVNLPLNANAVNPLQVTATDAFSNTVTRTINITQLSLQSLVVAEIRTEPLPPERIEQLVNDGVIDLEDPENFNVSIFDIVLTIGGERVPINIPIITPFSEPTGYEIIRLPRDVGNDGGSPPNPREIEIIVFEQFAPAPPGIPPPRIYGVMVIEGRIKSLKEFFAVRLLLMNTSGIFTLKDIMAQLSFPGGGLSHTLPSDGLISFGDILPGDGVVPGQKEREFIIRGDQVGVRPVKIDFGGTVAGPGLPEEDPIAFNGTAESSVEVKGPPNFLVQVFHPAVVSTNTPYTLTVEIQNTGDLPALYASLDLEVGADGLVESCAVNTNTADLECSFTHGPVTRAFGHIYPGRKVREMFTIMPLKAGPITSCLGISDQNIQLQVNVGNIGCLTGHFPPLTGVPEGIPAVSVLPLPNQLGVSPTAPVTAFFSELMNEGTITTGSNGTFNVFGPGGERVNGGLRFITIGERTVAIWQRDGGASPLDGNTDYDVLLTSAIVDLDGNPLFSPWSSSFRTTSLIDDQDPPDLTLTILPPTDPNSVLPGERVVVNAYPADQGTGVGRVELRIKDLDGTNALYQLVDQKTLFTTETQDPILFTIDTAPLIPGHAHQLLGSAYDLVGNVGEATIAFVLAASADPPVVVLPPDLTNDVLHGISIALQPLSVSGGVKQVAYLLDGVTNGTVFLPPWQRIISTLGLPLGVHTVTAVAVDALLQTGGDDFVFNLANNPNEPVVGFVGAVNGAEFLTNALIAVNGFAEDPTGIKSVFFYLNDVSGPPIASNSQPFQLSASGLPVGEHKVIILASNKVGVANNTAAASAIYEFKVIDAPPGPPPPAPVVTLVTEPENGNTTISGTSVSNAQVKVVNTSLGLTLPVDANAAGAFSAVISADGGNSISLSALNLAVSSFGSPTSTVVVPVPPAVTNLIIAPANRTFTAAGEFQDFTVTAQLAGGGTSNVTKRSTFSSGAPSVFTVNTNGRAVAHANGGAPLTATFRSNSVQANVTVAITVLTNLVVAPPSVLMVFTGQTEQLLVTGQYSDGSSSSLVKGVSFANSDPAVISVNSTGRVTAVADGNAQVYVSVGALPPTTVPVSVISGLNPPPIVNITSPAPGAGFQPGQPVNMTVNAVDPIAGVTKIFLSVTGAVTVADNRQISPPASNVTRSFSFVVPTNAPVGGSFTARSWAEDVAGLTSIHKSVTLQVVDQTAPTVNMLSPVSGQAYNAGHTVTVVVAAGDNVGVTEVGYTTAGGLTQSDARAIVPAATSTNVTFSFIVPPGASDPDLFIFGYARDAAGNSRTSSPVQVELTSADITPPETFVTALVQSTTVVHYTVHSGFEDLDYVQLFFRRDGIGTYNLYIDTDGTNLLGRHVPQSGTNGTIVFNAEKTGGDGFYEFYTVGFDQVGNREPAPTNGFDRATNINEGTVFVTINTSTNIAAGDTSLDGQNVRFSNAVVTIEGSHTFKNVELLGTSRLTHAAATLADEPAFLLQCWTLSVGSNATINVNAAGYLGGLRGGNDHTGNTTNNANGSTVRSGGSHGGAGGIFGGIPNVLYGNLTQPTDLGSGGSSDGGGNLGGNGGGRIRLDAIHVAADGPLSANGGTGTGNNAGSGSGGSIFILTHTLSGQGLIQANGGGFQVGGGGGRVAAHYTDISTKDTTLIQALGGQGSTVVGGNGTVFLKGFDEGDGTLVIDGQGVASPFSGLPIPQGFTFDNVIIRNNARVIVDDPITVNDSVQILNGSILTHSVNQSSGLVINARSVLVDGTSSMDVISKGKRGGLRDGNASHQGETLGGQLGARVRSGGSYGGLGGIVDGAGSNLVYGTPQEPIYLGAGGSSDGGGNLGGNGGGRVTINATDSVTVHGTIRADGGVGTGNNAGSGAGGSVRIATSLFQGSGVVSANGGAFQTSGGGGRIAVYYGLLGSGTNNFNALRNLTAHGGKGSTVAGSAGTVYLKQTTQAHGDLYLDEGLTNTTSTLWSPLTPLGLGKIQSVTTNELTLDGGVPVLPGGLAGLKLRPNVNHPATFTISENTTTTVTVQVVGGTNLTDVSALSDLYALQYTFDNVYFRRGAFLVTSDRLAVNGLLQIAENGLLTHFDGTLNYEPALDLTVGTLTVSSNSAINVDARGYLGGLRGGNDHTGNTTNNANGSGPRSGGSHGGRGGHHDGAGPHSIYGDLTAPVELGSGGSSDNGGNTGGDGGGRIRIGAGTMVNDGTITANGGTGSGNNAGSGSGGSVYLQVGSLNGAGLVRANGGGFQVGGGGGRVAVHYTTLGMGQGQFTTLGGAGSTAQGGNGTVFFKSAAQTHGELVIDGGNQSTPNDSTTLPAGFTFDNITLRNGARVVADQPINLSGTLSILSTSRLSHTRGLEAGIVINAAHVLVDGSSTIDVNAKGFRGGLRDGNASHQGETLNGQLGALPRAGGSYGGLGGIVSGAGGNLVYGTPQEPIYLGAGGSSDGGGNLGGNGGGRVTINATDSVTVHGTIRADGGVGTGNNAGSGAGGSVRIATSLFQGSGVVSANGGAFQCGAGGGRVAVYYGLLGGGTNNFNELRNLTAHGGKASTVAGSAGTVYLKQTTQAHGDLYLDEGLTNTTSTLWSPLTPLGLGKIQSVTTNELTLDGGVPVLPGGLAGLKLRPNVNHPATFTIADNTTTTVTVQVAGSTNLSDVSALSDLYALQYTFDNVYFRRGAFLVTSDRLTVNGLLQIAENGLLTHFDGTLNYEPALDLTVGTLTVSSNSAINVDARGYLGGLRGGNDHTGNTTNNANGSGPRSGGSHGGRGGHHDGAGPHSIYGDLTAPVELGSGGSSDNGGNTGGDGGGRIRIGAGGMVHDGTITANGGTGSGNNAGSGSGGSVYLQVSSLNGAGLVRANGGGFQVGGGGGRVAVHYTTLGMGQSQFAALGGAGSTVRGGNGTLFFKSATQANGDLVVDGQGATTPLDSTPIPAALIFDNITFQNSAQISLTSPLVVSGLVQVVSNSVIRHPLSQEAGLTIQARNLLIDGSSSIDVTARGHRGGLRDGNAIHQGLTTNDTPGSTVRSAGSHGGLGAAFGGAANPVYGVDTNPVHLGSGGSSDGGGNLGGHGGGRVTLLIESNLTLNGVVRTDGGVGTANNAGSGSGGSILIRVHTFEGTGTLEADGGAFQVGGGGGRIAVFHDTLTFDTNSATAAGGAGSTVAGTAGTVHFAVLPGGPGPFALPGSGPSGGEDGDLKIGRYSVGADGTITLQWDAGSASPEFVLESTSDLLSRPWTSWQEGVEGLAWTGLVHQGDEPARFFRLRRK